MKVSINDLRENPENPRSISGEKFEKLVNSIRQFPEMMEARPIVVDQNNVILGGNMRFKAAKEAGLQEVDVYVASWDEAKNPEFIIKDNVGFGEWDWDMLANEWDAVLLDDWGLDVWQEEEEKEGLTDPDEVPEVPADPVTQPGDLWILGEHRLLCGDSTKAEDMERLMDGKLADLWLTDPPYNVALGMNESVEEAKRRNRRTDGKVVQNDEMSDSEFRQFLCLAYGAANDALRKGAAFYIWHADSEGYNFRGAARDTGWQVRQCLIWTKSSLVMGRQDYHWQHEPCLYGWTPGAGHTWNSDRKQSTLLQFDKPSRSSEHPTMKPVELVEYCMGNSSTKGEIVLDSFLGSGSTLIAAEKTGRKCYGMELDPKYCDVIVKRWEDFTGQKASKANA